MNSIPLLMLLHLPQPIVKNIIKQADIGKFSQFKLLSTCIPDIVLLLLLLDASSLYEAEQRDLPTL